ncbi:phosphotransferase [Ottowia sp.]|uniref:aminoglycoside phosphotransferase family protein n=1 Tax=Ottowia sp. TaxID=1898956 RepID=UPI002C8D99E4|nr:phosphotransferase [Ottowia sp.]HOB66689.1 phosphotransferase [Ottowia sp.]HPZ55697.1 phosphotransferase [Ottowia sp.]HQD46314.1 phosphotransferase [Ottowia sp.]
MSDATPAPLTPSVSAASAPGPAPTWVDPARHAAFDAWLAGVAGPQALRPDSLRVASADASFRRYLRIDTQDGGSRIIMDAPPAHENCAPFVHVAGLMQAAGLNVPRVLAWDEPNGFMLLTDLGAQTMMAAIDPDRPEANRPLYEQAVDALLRWQQASRPGVLPPYDEAVLRRELALFPDWYLAQHRGVAVEGALRDTLNQTFDLIVARNLAAPSVYVHRDFMPRNLMLPNVAANNPPPGRPKAGSAPSGGSADTLVRSVGGSPLGVLDFQDALYGPATYDIASLMRDAFLTWDEEFVLDITVRYWERARKLGLMDFEDWHSDFGSFWRAVEWMGLQRHLKVAGIFARLTLRDGKPKYLADAPRFIAYIRHTASRYRELAPLLKAIDQIEGTEAVSGWAYGRV